MRKISLDDFILRAKNVHGDKYDYAKVIYKNIDTNVIIICKIHGEFSQIPYSHLVGQKCPTCALEQRKIARSLGRDEFIARAIEIHHDEFNYTKLVYVNRNVKVEIICKIHGSFWQKPEVHLSGFKCSKCSGLAKLDTKIFIEKSNIVHNNKYDYSIVKYQNTRSKVQIICPTHGVFSQTVTSHLAGRGCGKCLFKGQTDTGIFLRKIFPNALIREQFHIAWNNIKFVVDFLVIENNRSTIVEYNGPHHYEPTNYNGGISKKDAERKFIKQLERDKNLRYYCEANNITLLEIDGRITFGNQIYDYLLGKLIMRQPLDLLEVSYGFEDIAIKQQKNVCESRLAVDTRVEIIKDVKVDVGLIASNMSTVINSDFYTKLVKTGAFGVLHRAGSKEYILSEIKKAARQCEWVASSIGIDNDQFDMAKEMIENGCNIIVIDIAHGYSDAILNLAKKIKSFSSTTKLVIGNTTNVDLLYESYKFVDAIKVGIAQGFACETKNTAGCTEKQFSAVYKFKQPSKDFGIPIISDGGIREPADFVKAIAAGANSVMAGKIFAACPESAAEDEVKYSDDGNIVSHKKIYAGMASRYVQERWKGGLKPGTCPEGGVRYLDLGEPLVNLLERYSGALKSGITYAGAKDIQSFHQNVKFVRFC